MTKVTDKTRTIKTHKEVKTFYNDIYHQYYDDVHEVSCNSRKINEHLLAQLRDSVKGALLDIGCGGQQPVSGSIGSDISFEAIRIRKGLFPGSLNLCSDICHLPFQEGIFSGILAGLMFDHVAEPQAAFASLRRISIEGARLILTIFDATRLPEGNYPDNRLRYESTKGEEFLVPSYSYSPKELEKLARLEGWELSSPVISHKTTDPHYRLLQLNFRHRP